MHLSCTTIFTVFLTQGYVVWASFNNKYLKGPRYSKEVNRNADKLMDVNFSERSSVNFGAAHNPPGNYSTSSDRHFRVLKIQNIWQKGQKILNEAKLKALFHDLKVQDARELEFKKIKSQGKDKDGLKEAGLRSQLSEIIQRYGLAASFPEHEASEGDGHQFERIFKDKKLNKLWNKIEAAGLDEREMKIFKEELEHHQVKLDQYYAFVDNLHDYREKTPEHENSLEHFLEDEVVALRRSAKEKGSKMHPVEKRSSLDVNEQVSEELSSVSNEARIKHEELKTNFDSIAKKVRERLNEKEFEGDKAKRLWELAQKADFTKEELSSLRAELHHFEHRIRKLNHYAKELEYKENPDEAKPLKSKVNDLQRKVEKVQDELRGRIARRTEL